MKNLSVTQAEKNVLKNVKRLPIISVTLDACEGRILAEDLRADRDQPSSDRSSMDGIAVSYAAWKKGIVSFHIRGIQAAGIPQKVLRKQDDCFEIMTGAVVPKGCDCVVPVEAIQVKGKIAVLNPRVILRPGQFVRKQASEYRKGAFLLQKNITLNPAHISIIGSIGKAKVKVFSPRIAVIGTGDELVEINKPVKPYQARRSNAYALEALLKRNGFLDVKRFHLNDNLPELRRELKKILSAFDIVILSGGVSMGKFDFIPQVMKELKVNVVFHKVSQRPGRPFWFGLTKDRRPVFALPGNPVSTQVCAYRYVLPYLKKAAGLKDAPEFLLLANSFPANLALTLFIPVMVKQNMKAQMLAFPVDFAGSGDYAALRKAAGFIELPMRARSYAKGERVRFFRW